MVSQPYNQRKDLSKNGERYLSADKNNFTEELISNAKAGDADATMEIIEQYKYYIFKMIKNIYLRDYEKEDLIQLGYISIIKAINNYDSAKGNFTNYVTLAIKNNFFATIKKYAKLNECSSLDEMITENLSLEDIIGTEESSEDIFINDESNKEFLIKVDKLPSELKEIIYYVYINEDGNLRSYAKKNHLNYSTVAKRRKRALQLLSSRNSKL